MTATGQSNKLLRLLCNYYSKKKKKRTNVCMFPRFRSSTEWSWQWHSDGQQVWCTEIRLTLTSFSSLFFFFFYFFLFHLSHPSQESQEDSVLQKALSRGSVNTVQLYCTSGEVHLLTSSSKHNKTSRIISTYNKILHIVVIIEDYFTCSSISEYNNKRSTYTHSLKVSKIRFKCK